MGNFPVPQTLVMIIELALALALVQQPTIALQLRGETVVVSVREAERLALSGDRYERAAAELALGSRATPVADNIPAKDRERLRWRRLPAQVWR